MSDDLPATPNIGRINQGLRVSRVLVVLLALLPILVLVFSVVFTIQTNANPADNPQLYDAIQSYIYAAIVASCLLIPVVAYIGLRLTFRKRAVTQEVHRGSVYLGALVVWLIYAFLTLALFILWNLSPAA